MAIESRHNPRNLRDKYKDWVGKKVIVGLTTFHYLCGRWKDIEGYYAQFQIGDKVHQVPLDQIDNVADASEAQAEYFK